MKFPCILAAVAIGTAVVPAGAAEPGKPGGTLVIVQSQVDKWLSAAGQELDQAKRRGLYVKVQEQLAKHPLVKSYRAGGYGEGGAGVTIVELASK